MSVGSVRGKKEARAGGREEESRRRGQCSHMMGYVPSVRKKKKSMQSQCWGTASNLQKDTRWLSGSVWRCLGEPGKMHDMTCKKSPGSGQSHGQTGTRPCVPGPVLTGLIMQPYCPAVAPPTKAAWSWSKKVFCSTLWLQLFIKIIHPLWGI